MKRLLKYYQHLSINKKLIVAYIAFVVVIGGAGTLLVIHNEKSIIQQEHIALALNLAENVPPILLIEHRMMLNRLVQIVGKMSDVKDCSIINREGIVVAHTNMGVIGKTIPVGPMARKAYREKGYYYFHLDAQGIEGVYAPAYSQGKYLGSVVVTFEPIRLLRLFKHPRRATVENILMVLLFVAIFGLIAAFIITKLIAYPVHLLTDKIYDVLRGKFPRKKMPMNYVYCWEELDCKQEDCPSYGNREEKCWTVAGTFCKGQVQGVHAQKIGDCRKCVVYQKNSGDELEQLNDGFDIMVRDLVYNTERMKEAKENIELYAKQLERANTENETLRVYNEQILNSLSSAVISMDENLIIQKYNQAAQTILGGDLDRLLGKNIYEVQKICTRCNEFFGMILKAIERYQKEGNRLIGHEATVARMGGDPMTLSLSVLPLYGNRSGGASPIIVVFEDITEKEKMREELNISRHLAELGEVAAKVAHDVRNPLNAIEGGVHYLISKYKDDTEIQNISNLVRGQVQRLNNVTSDLLKVSNPMVPNFSECDLNGLLEESTSFLVEEINTAGIDLVQDLDRRIPHLCIDSNQIQRVVINLLENAMEAMPTGGSIRLSTRSVTNGRQGEWVEVSVQDTGRGVPEEIKDSIFKPFYTTKVNGTGLGLAIVRQIITQHQGDLKVQKRNDGPGTEVIIHLPVKITLKEKMDV
jgi:two-component system NtrC family sensor kinase